MNQRFDYLNNPVYHYGEQSLELGVRSLLRIGPGGLHVTTKVAGDVVMISAMQPLDDGPPREIDWGPGVGAIGEVTLSTKRTTYLSFFNRVRHLRSVSGVPADHTILFSGLDVTIPITRGLGIGAHLSGDRRTSDYHEAYPDAERSYAETRIYLTWTFAGSTPGR